MNHLKSILSIALACFLSNTISAGVKTTLTKNDKKQRALQILALSKEEHQVQSKFRSGSRLIGSVRQQYQGSSYVPQDSTQYLYNSTYGYDPTPEMFDMFDINSFLYDNFMNYYDKSLTWDMTSTPTLSDSMMNTFTTGHKLQHSVSRNIPFSSYSSTFFGYNTAGQKIQSIDTFNMGTLNAYQSDFTLNAQNKVWVIKNKENGVFVSTDSLYYNVEGRLIKVIEFDDQDEFSFKLDIAYNSQNLIESLSYSDWTGSVWSNTDKTEYFYNSGNHISSVYYSNFDGSNWVYDSKDTLSYTTSTSYPSKVENFVYNLSSMMFENNSKSEYTYNSNDQVLSEEYFYYSTVYTPSYKTMYYYQTYAPTSIPNEAIIQGLTIYPNPTQDWLQVSLEGSTGDVEISILNLSGQVIKRYISTSSSIRLDTQSLPEGSYYVQVINQGKQSVQSFTKMN